MEHFQDYGDADDIRGIEECGCLSGTGPASGNTDAGTTLDMGVYEPLTGGDTEWGMKESRGWSGSAVKNLGIAVNGFTDTATYNTSRKAYVSGKTTRAFRPGPIQEGIWAVELGLGWLPSATDDPDGIHWEVEVQTTTDSSWSNTPYVPDNYAPYVANPSAGWYDGDFHTHGEQEPGNAPMDQTFAKGFGAGPTGNALDFMTLVDHNNMVARGEIGRYDQNYAGKLIMQGTEVTTYNGHWNSQNAGQLADFRAGPIVRFDDADADNQVEAGELPQVRASLDPSGQFAASSASGGWGAPRRSTSGIGIVGSTGPPAAMGTPRSRGLNGSSGAAGGHVIGPTAPK